MKVSHREGACWSVIEMYKFSVNEIKNLIEFTEDDESECSGFEVEHLESGITVITYFDEDGENFDWIAPTNQFVEE